MGIEGGPGPKGRQDFVFSSEEDEGGFNEHKTKVPDHARVSNELIRSYLERQSISLPATDEELYEQFDSIIPKDLGDITFAGKGGDNVRMSRDDIRETIEKNLWGASLSNVDTYVDNAIQNIESNPGFESDRFADQSTLIELHDQFQNAQVGMSEKNYNKTLTALELLSVKTFTKRLQAEVGINPSELENLISRLHTETQEKGSVQPSIEDMKAYFEKQIEEIQQSGEHMDVDHYIQTIDALDKGDYGAVLGQIKLEISAYDDYAQELRTNNSATRQAAQEYLTRRFGQKYKNEIASRLDLMRNAREVIKREMAA